MHSKNKPAMTAQERAHVGMIKEMNCIVCDDAGPCDAHEIEQGQWFTSLPLCRSCHMDSRNGIHGQKAMWRIMKMNELSALNELLRKFL